MQATKQIGGNQKVKEEIRMNPRIASPVQEEREKQHELRETEKREFCIRKS